VIEHQPTTIEEILNHARIAEMTRLPTSDSGEGLLSKQMAALQATVSELNSKFEKRTTAQLSPHRSLWSPSPARRHVSFDSNTHDTSQRETRRP